MKLMLFGFKQFPSQCVTTVFWVAVAIQTQN